MSTQVLDRRSVPVTVGTSNNKISFSLEKDEDSFKTSIRFYRMALEDLGGGSHKEALSNLFLSYENAVDAKLKLDKTNKMENNEMENITKLIDSIEAKSWEAMISRIDGSENEGDKNKKKKKSRRDVSGAVSPRKKKFDEEQPKRNSLYKSLTTSTDGTKRKSKIAEHVRELRRDSAESDKEDDIQTQKKARLSTNNGSLSAGSIKKKLERTRPTAMSIFESKKFERERRDSKKSREQVLQHSKSETTVSNGSPTSQKRRLPKSPRPLLNIADVGTKFGSLRRGKKKPLNLSDESMTSYINLTVEDILSGYKDQFLRYNARKSRIKGKRLVIKEEFQHTYEPIKEPITNFESHEISSALFRCIMEYMGDLPISSSYGSLDPKTTMIKSMIATGIENDKIRDELYCQVLKQITNNPNLESTKRGWELISLYLNCFLPTDTLLSCIEQILKLHIQLGNKEIANAALDCTYSLKTASKHITWLKVPNDEQIKEIIRLTWIQSPMRTTLNVLMKRQKDKYPELTLPWILHSLSNRILNDSDIQGNKKFFTTEVNKSDIDKLKEQFISNPKYIVDNTTPLNTAASLIKEWLKHLEEPVIPHEYYSILLSKPNEIDHIHEILQNLPQNNQNVIYHLVSLCQQIKLVSNCEANSHSLAVLISPNLFRCPEIFDGLEKEEKMRLIAKLNNDEVTVLETLLNELVVFI